MFRVPNSANKRISRRNEDRWHHITALLASWPSDSQHLDTVYLRVSFCRRLECQLSCCMHAALHSYSCWTSPRSCFARRASATSASSNVSYLLIWRSLYTLSHGTYNVAIQDNGNPRLLSLHAHVASHVSVVFTGGHAGFPVFSN